MAREKDDKRRETQQVRGAELDDDLDLEDEHRQHQLSLTRLCPSRLPPLNCCLSVNTCLFCPPQQCESCQLFQWVPCEVQVVCRPPAMSKRKMWAKGDCTPHIAVYQRIITAGRFIDEVASNRGLYWEKELARRG